MSQMRSFVEPSGSNSAGRGVVERQSFLYEDYMVGEGIPIYEGGGFRDVRDLSLGSWHRRGGNGAFLAIDQLAHVLGLYVIEVPPDKSLNLEHHVFEEKFLVLEGSGTTEIYGTAFKSFLWNKGALFAIPLNVTYKLKNTGSKPALLLSANTAPSIINAYDRDFAFSCDYKFVTRYDEEDDYFAPSLNTIATPELGRAMWQTNFIPDIINCELPLDNVRSPGYRRIELPHMAGSNFWGFVGEYPSGRYAKAHYHGPGAVLVCVKGKGYTYTWPSSIGMTPWKDGKQDLVERIDYVAGGMVAAAPGSGDWFHQHFSTGQEPMRMVVFHGFTGGPYRNFGGRSRRGKSVAGKELGEGGNAISYKLEDPFIREEYEQILERDGVHVDMPEPR